MDGIFFIKNYWETNISSSRKEGIIPLMFVYIAVPIYILIWLLSVYLSGGYDKPISRRRSCMGWLAGTISSWCLQPSQRELPVFHGPDHPGAIWGTFAMLGLRLLLHLLGINRVQDQLRKEQEVYHRRGKGRGERVSDLLQKTVLSPGFIGLVSYHHHRNNTNGFLGHVGQIKEIITYPQDR